MSQLSATFGKTGKFFMRNRALLLGIVLWPMILTAIMATTELATIPSADKPLAMGYLTVSMVVFAIMLACIMTLPTSIARDREIGLLVKLRSMPINSATDTFGRLLAFLAFAIIVAGLVVLVGLALGASFSGNMTTYLESACFLLIAIVGASGVGLIMGSFIKSVQGTAFLGLAVTLGLSFTSGILVPYIQLSWPLQVFSRFLPMSSGASSIEYLILGNVAVGYNPITISQVTLSLIVALALLVVGLILYHWTSWSHTRRQVHRGIIGHRLLRDRIRAR